MKFSGLNRATRALVSTTAIAAATIAAAPLAAQDAAAEPTAETEGEIVVTSLRRSETLQDIIAGWEAFYSGVDGVMKGAYRPFLTGEASNDIVLADIDHWLFDGDFSADAPVIIIPCNRASAVAAAGASATDASTEANQRDQMRNWAHILNYTVGPEMTVHKLEGENAASGALVAATHWENNDYEGDIWAAVLFARTGRMALGEETYPGTVFFETISAGTAANKVKVRLGLPRLQPGLGLAEDATGYSTGAQSGSFAPKERLDEVLAALGFLAA
jgi:hypothetical protein